MLYVNATAQGNPYSITVGDTELNPNRYVLGNPQVRAKVAQLYENIGKRLLRAVLTSRVEDWAR